MLKHLLVLTLFIFQTPKSIAETATLRDHMRAMGYLMDEINANSADLANFHEAAAQTRALRSELVQSIALEPSKFAGLEERQHFAARIEFHQILSRVIYLAASLEKTLDAQNDELTESGSRMEDVRNILHEINVLVGQAHRKFRD